VGQKYEVAVCFVYQIDAEGKIAHLREYLDMASLMKQFKSVKA
jgi:ketosteroid isomerase-like protein